jgi:hypothetical protein
LLIYLSQRCFSFGIGSGASSTLVKGIAEAGKGAAEFITSGERMQAKVKLVKIITEVKGLTFTLCQHNVKGLTFLF